MRPHQKKPCTHLELRLRSLLCPIKIEPGFQLSAVGWLLAKAVLQRLEAIVFQTFHPKIWKMYVVDTFVIKDTDIFSDFHIVLNNALPGIQFTLDKENDNNLHFLDRSIHHLPTGTLKTSVYRKSTHSDVVLHSQSNSPASQTKLH